MNARSWVLTGVGCGIVGAFAFVYGLRFGTIEVVAAPPSDHAFEVVAAPPDLSKDLSTATAANRRLLDRIAQLEALLAAGREDGESKTVVVRPGDVDAAEGENVEPLAFRADLDYAYTPDGFEEVTRRMIAECGLGLEVVTIDCAEYPCMAWTRAEQSEGRSYSMDGCPVWTDAFPNGTTVIGSATANGANGTPERYLAWMAAPENPEELRQAWKRAKARADEMKAALGLQ